MQGDSVPARTRRTFRLAIWNRERANQDVDEEMRFHLEARCLQLEQLGMSEEQARDEATRRFGSLDDARARLRRSAAQRDRKLRLRDVLEVFARDACFALRSLRRSPAFVIVAVLCLSLGIGANAAIFSVIDAVLLRPLPFAHPDRLVRIWPDGAAPPGVFEIVGGSSRTLSGLAGYVDGRKVSVAGNGTPVRYVASDVSSNLFDVLGAHASLGRTFVQGDNVAGRDKLLLLSDAVWREHYGGDPAIVGRTVTVDGILRQVIGVMPPDFRFPTADAQLWMPAGFDRAAASYWWGTPLRLIGRLGDGATIAQARAELALTFARARTAFPMRMPDDWGKNPDVLTLRESIVGAARPTLVVLFAAVALVLLIACVNVATLSLERGTAREREIAIHTALGAGRPRILARLLTESVIVATLGAIAGLALAEAGVRVLVALLPAGTPRAESIAIDGRVLLFALGLAVICGLAFGLLPAIRASQLHLHQSLRDDGRAGDGPRRANITYALAVTQVALAVVIVTTAGLMLESLWRLQHVDLGFDTQHVFAAEIPVPSFDRDTATRAPAFYEALLERARGVRGVREIAVGSSLPFGAVAYGAAMEVEAHPTVPGAAPALPIRTTVSPDYFHTLRIPLLSGRMFTTADRANASQVALIDAAAAKAYWPTENAVGQRIRYVWKKDWITVVGVVGNVTRDSLSGSTKPSIYIPLEQGFGEPMMLVTRAADGTDQRTLTPAIREVLSNIDPSIPANDLRQLRGLVDDSSARSRFAAFLLSLFAAVALVLGATGIYGIMNASVSRREREIGVRMALGATSRGVMRMVLGASARATASGIAIGVVGAVAVGGLLRGVVYGVSAIDVPVLVLVALLLAVTALLASLVPALRASQVDPQSAIRAD